MIAIERIIRVAKDQQQAGFGSTSDQCNGTCQIHMCATRRSGRVIETLALETAQHIEKLTQALQAVIRHAKFTGNQSPNDCLVQCIADAKKALGIPDTDAKPDDTGTVGIIVPSHSCEASARVTKCENSTDEWTCHFCGKTWTKPCCIVWTFDSISGTFMDLHINTDNGTNAATEEKNLEQ